MGLKTLFVINTFTCIGYCLLISLCWKISASTAKKYITINICGKDDLSIKCSIINSGQLDPLQLIQLERASGSTFVKVISILKKINDKRQITWKDEDLKNRATANGSIEEAELRLFIDKDRVQNFTDFTTYRCSMEGILNSTQKNGSLVTDSVASSIDTCACMYVCMFILNTINLILLKLYADLLNAILKKEMFVLFIKLYKL